MREMEAVNEGRTAAENMLLACAGRVMAARRIIDIVACCTKSWIVVRL